MTGLQNSTEKKEEGSTITGSETVYDPPQGPESKWGLAGPVMDFLDYSQAQFASSVEPGQSTNPSLLYSAAYVAVAGQIHRAPSLLAESMWGGLCVPAPGAAASSHDSPELRRVERKRDKGTNNNRYDKGLGADNNDGRRPGNKPAAKVPASVNTSKAVGFRADMPMIPIAQGGCDQLMQGPNSQQDLTGRTAQEELPSAERSVQGATRAQCDPMQQEDDKLGATKDNRFYISKRRNEDYKSFLTTTSEDFARGTLHELKCKLCPAADFTTWDDFIRHCKTAEAHPLEILFCDYCGTYFARRDSLNRHFRNRPPECLYVSPREAEDKWTETKRIHEEFKKDLKDYLKTNDGNWRSFAQIMKERHPESPKKGSREQSRLQASGSRSS